MQNNLLLVNTTVLEMLYQGFVRKALVFGKSYGTRNILPRFCTKSPTFGKSDSTRNILPMFRTKSPTSGKYYGTRNVIPRVCTKYPKYFTKVLYKKP